MLRKNLALLSMALFLLVLAAGCGSDQKQQTAMTDTTTTSQPAGDPTLDRPVEQPVAEAPPPKPKATTPAKTESKPKPKPVEPEPEKPKMVTIPTGTAMAVSLETHLRTDSNQTGDPFMARTTEAIRVDGMTAIPAGSMVHGRLTHVEEPHRTSGKAQMTLSFDKIIDATGASYEIAVAPIALEGEGDKISDEEKVAGGAVIGGIIGALTSKKKGKGALTGAAAGAAAGGAVALATKGKQLDLPVGQQFALELTAPVVVQASQETAGK